MNQSKVDLVHQTMTHGALESLDHHPGVAKGYLVRLDRLRWAHDQTTLRHEVGMRMCFTK